ncbi:MAG: 3-oxoacyl-[acyl-carrier-protein] reductase [Phycisphaerales bacterium]
MNESAPTRVALVTGASRGIGKAIAQRLAADGRKVVLAARSEGALNEVADEIRSAGGEASVATLDVSDADVLASGIEGIIETEGRLDIIVNNAGITRDNLALRMSDEDFMEVLRVNLLSAFVVCRTAARSMMRNKFGRIVNIASTSGVVGNAGQANYAAAKAGLIGMTKSLARELGGKAITANAIAPGFIETDMTASLGDDIKSRIMESMALRRLGQPEDIAAAVAYVSSDAAGFLTGQTICVDGGLTMC